MGLESLVALATTEVKKTGIFTIPGLCRIKTRVKPATKAGLRMAFGQEVKVKAIQPGLSSRLSQLLRSRPRFECHLIAAMCCERSRDPVTVGIPWNRFLSSLLSLRQCTRAVRPLP